MTIRKVLLVCGMLSPLLYAVADGLAGIQWESYSFRDQTISELGAIGAPSRPLFAALLIPTYLLLVAFGAGVWRSAEGRRSVRLAAGLLMGLGVLALTAGQFVPMRPRGTEQGLAGALHLIEGGVAMLLLLAAMGLMATALGRRFRLYTITTIVLILVFGAWSGMDAPHVEAGLPTPWLGVKERIFWYSYQAWFIVLALALLRQWPGDALTREGGMQIRAEKAEDRLAVRTVNESAFETATEANLVDALRQQAQPLVSLVAEQEGRIVGHIMFSPVVLPEHPELRLMGLAPMAVLPARQRTGVGSALVRAGLEECRKRDVGAVVVLGHPDYYPRFGFVPASRYGIGCEYDVPDEVFMVIELQHGYLAGISGKVRYHEAFADV